MPSQTAATDLAALGLNVSRETLSQLGKLLEILEKWQKAINLVAPQTLPDAWRRHILDSAQIWPLAPPSARVWVDFGSGGGFPGLVLAILGAPEIHLLESDQKKAVFLREAARELGLEGVQVHAQRIEAVNPFPADILTARALAPLGDLLALAQPFFGAQTLALFPKGRAASDELTLARKIWQFECETRPSQTSPESHILMIRHVRPL